MGFENLAVYGRNIYYAMYVYIWNYERVIGNLDDESEKSDRWGFFLVCIKARTSWERTLN